MVYRWHFQCESKACQVLDICSAFYVLFIVIMLYLKRIFKCKNKEMLELAANGLHSFFLNNS